MERGNGVASESDRKLAAGVLAVSISSATNTSIEDIAEQ